MPGLQAVHRAETLKRICALCHVARGRHAWPPSLVLAVPRRHNLRVAQHEVGLSETSDHVEAIAAVVEKR